VVFGGNANDVLATLGLSCALAKWCEPLQCEFKQTLFVDEGNKLLGKAFAAEWPEPGARAATQDNGGNSHVTDLWGLNAGYFSSRQQIVPFLINRLMLTVKESDKHKTSIRQEADEYPRSDDLCISWLRLRLRLSVLIGDRVIGFTTRLRARKSSCFCLVEISVNKMLMC